MPAVGLTLSLPQRIGTLSDLFVLLPIHGQYPPHFLGLRLTLASAATKLPLVCSRGRLVCRTLAPGLRTNRLLRILRAASRPVTAASLADELEVTVRTVYRDVATLQARRIPSSVRPGLAMYCRAASSCRP
jgi:hypothetical protein